MGAFGDELEWEGWRRCFLDGGGGRVFVSRLENADVPPVKRGFQLRKKP